MWILLLNKALAQEVQTDTCSPLTLTYAHTFKMTYLASPQTSAALPLSLAPRLLNARYLALEVLSRLVRRGLGESAGSSLAARALHHVRRAAPTALHQVSARSAILKGEEPINMHALNILNGTWHLKLACAYLHGVRSAVRGRRVAAVLRRLLLPVRLPRVRTHDLHEEALHGATYPRRVADA